MFEEVQQERNYWKRQYELKVAENEYHRQSLLEQNNYLQQLQTDHALQTMKMWDEANHLTQVNETLSYQLSEAQNNNNRLNNNYNKILDASLKVVTENENLQQQLEQTQEELVQVGPHYRKMINKIQKEFRQITTEKSQLEVQLTQQKKKSLKTLLSSLKRKRN